MKSQTALITGSSSGIGTHLAHEFARNGHSLVLVAPQEDELKQVASDIRQAHGVSVNYIAKDLEQELAAQEIIADLTAKNLSIDILVNNAGHGFRGKFSDYPLETDLSMIKLNIEAYVRLTKAFLPLMIQKGSGSLLMTASVAGFEPGPLLAVYHATKAFVLSWSEALSVELEGTGVRVTILCPGPTDTDFFPKANMTDTNAFQKAKVMAPQEVAKAAYEGWAKDELLVIPGGMNQMLVSSRRFLTVNAQAKMNEKMYEKAEPEDRKRQRGDVEDKHATR